MYMTFTYLRSLDDGMYERFWTVSSAGCTIFERVGPFISLVALARFTSGPNFRWPPSAARHLLEDGTKGWMFDFPRSYTTTAFTVHTYMSI